MLTKSKPVLEKLIKALNKCEMLLIAYFPLLIAILMVIELLNRKIGLGFRGFYWLEELGRYMLIFITFLGTSIAVKSRSHPKMEVLYAKLPTQAAHLLWGIVFCGCFAFIAYIAFYAWRHIFNLSKIGVSTSTLSVPLYVAYFPIAFFGSFIALRYLIESIKEFQAFLKVRKEGKLPEYYLEQ